MNTNHQMNYYDYAKTLSAEGVMTALIGGGAGPEPEPEPIPTYPETLIVSTRDYADGSETFINDNGLVSRDYDEIRIFKTENSEEVTISDLYIDPDLGWVGHLLTNIYSLSGYKAEYIIQGEPIVQGNANFVIDQ